MLYDIRPKDARTGIGHPAIHLSKSVRVQLVVRGRTLVRNVLAVSLVLLLVACDPVTYGRIDIDSQIPFDRQCLIRVQNDLSDKEPTKGMPPQSGGLEIRRGFASATILPDVGATSLTLSFKWLGESKADEERDSFDLLDDLHSTIVRTCLSSQSQATVRRTCSARLCEKWLAANES